MLFSVRRAANYLFSFFCTKNVFINFHSEYFKYKSNVFDNDALILRSCYKKFCNFYAKMHMQRHYVFVFLIAMLLIF